MRGVALAALAALVLLAPAPGSAWHDEQPTTSTGDVDVHAGPPGIAGFCLPFFGRFVVVLTLLDRSPVDRVLLAVDGGWFPNAGGAAVASHAQPRVSVTIDVNGCSPFPSAIVVAGLLVDGERPYTLEFASA